MRACALELIKKDILAFQELTLEDFIQQSNCPSCRSSLYSLIFRWEKNIVWGRRFPVGTFLFSDDLRRERHLRKCQSCGLIYQAWIPSKELLLRVYSQKKDNGCKPWPPNKRRLTWGRALSHMPSPPGRLLDVGANDGHFLSLLPPQWKLAALEPAGASRTELKNLSVEVFEGFMDDETLDLPRESFDVVCLFDVLEHFSDVSKAMLNLSNCLKPGGLAILETGNAESLPAKIFESMWWYYDYIEHLVFFDKRSLKKALGNSSLRMTYYEQVIHTGFRSRSKMWFDLCSKVITAWRRKSKIRIGRDNERIYLNHPLRVYWPDHMFIVAQKERS